MTIDRHFFMAEPVTCIRSNPLLSLRPAAAQPSGSFRDPRHGIIDLDPALHQAGTSNQDLILRAPSR